MPHSPSPLHLPVMLEEAVHWLAPQPGATLVDATVGYGGHAEALLASVMPGGRLIGLDRDPAALKSSGERLAARCRREGWAEDSFMLRQADFRTLPEALASLGLGPVEGILLDLGVSSPQLNEAERGFSFRRSGPLDMRMSPGDPTTAAELVNTWPEDELARLIWEYGEERHSRRIAREIVRRRQLRPLQTTDELAAAVIAGMPPAARHRRTHAATRTFQALRIAVNQELSALEAVLEALPDLLAPGGRFVALSYHSLEDRLVKRALLRHSGRCQCPPELPTCQCGASETMRILTRKPLTPGEAEVSANPRARGAKLRAAERL